MAVVRVVRAVEEMEAAEAVAGVTVLEVVVADAAAPLAMGPVATARAVPAMEVAVKVKEELVDAAEMAEMEAEEAAVHKVMEVATAAVGLGWAEAEAMAREATVLVAKAKVAVVAVTVAEGAARVELVIQHRCSPWRLARLSW